VKNEAVGATVEDAEETREGRDLRSDLVTSRASPLELLLERAVVELGTESESAAFCRTPRTPEQSAATWGCLLSNESSRSHVKVMKTHLQLAL
jgi:hypothetical protein